MPSLFALWKLIRKKSKYVRNYAVEILNARHHDAIIRIKISLANAMKGRDRSGERERLSYKIKMKVINSKGAEKFSITKFNLCKQKIFIGACNCAVEKNVRTKSDFIPVVNKRFKLYLNELNLNSNHSRSSCRIKQGRTVELGSGKWEKKKVWCNFNDAIQVECFHILRRYERMIQDANYFFDTARVVFSSSSFSCWTPLARKRASSLERDRRIEFIFQVSVWEFFTLQGEKYTTNLPHQ